MATPQVTDFHTYNGTKLTNADWDFDNTQVISYLTSGGYDMTFNSWAVNSACSMGSNNIQNLADPINNQDAATKNFVLNSVTPQGYINGFILSNDATAPNTVLDIAVGQCIDSTNAKGIVLASALTKSLASNWVSGTGNGGLDTGTKATSTWYHVFIILNATSGAVDVLFSTSATNPLLPTGYTYFRRIGSIYTNSSGNITPFTQDNDMFTWAASVNNYSGGIGGSASDLILSTPLGVRTFAYLGFTVTYTGSGTGTFNIYIKDKISGASWVACNTGCIQSDQSSCTSWIYTDLASKIQFWNSANAGNGYIYTIGYKDGRGKR